MVALFGVGGAATDIDTKPQGVERTKTKQPPLYKVILLNYDYTPRECVVVVLKGVFRMIEEQSYVVMMTTHQR